MRCQLGFEKDSMEQAGASIADCLLNIAAFFCVYIASYYDLTHA